MNNKKRKFKFSTIFSSKKIVLGKYICLVLGILIFGSMLFAPAFVVAQETEKKQINAAENISVKLQIPLPFVETNCETIDAKGNTHEAVCDLPTYIKGVYRLLIGAGALFAVVMMIIAGYQWMFSGGSSDKTGAAKKRIFNAWIGLILALLSYVILNTITPRLVALRLPVIEPVPGFDFNPSETCQTNQDFINYEIKHDIAEGDLPIWRNMEIKEELRESVGSSEVRVDDHRKTAVCGVNYKVDDVKGEVMGECKGGYCDSRMACVAEKCLPVWIYGDARSSNFKRVMAKAQLYSVCDDEVNAESAPQDVIGTYYSIPLQPEFWDVYFESPQALWGVIGDQIFSYFDCQKDELKGYLIRVEVDDGFGINNDYAVGRGCSQAIILPSATDASFNTFEEALEDLSDSDINAIVKPLLIKPEELPYNCNINIRDSSFPDYD